MLIIPAPSTPALFATKLVLYTRIDPVWKIAPPEVPVKSIDTVNRREGHVRSTKNLCNRTCSRVTKVDYGVGVEEQSERQ